MIFDKICALPLVGSARTRLQIMHLTVVVAEPKIFCSLPHSGHLTSRNLDRGCGINFSTFIWCLLNKYVILCSLFIFNSFRYCLKISIATATFRSIKAFAFSFGKTQISSGEKGPYTFKSVPTKESTCSNILIIFFL